MTQRRDELLSAATDYVLEHGLIGLSLRPLATALDTSDRMLIYHFGSKDELVAAVIEASNARSLVIVAGLPPARGVAAAVRLLWQAMLGPDLEACQRVYTEASALGLLGREPYVGPVRAGNAAWLAGLTAYLASSGAAPDRAPRIAYLLDAAMMGLQLDLSLDRDSAALARAVDDLAAAAEAIDSL